MVTKKRARGSPKKYMVVAETMSSKGGLSYGDAQDVKKRLIRKLGRRKGNVARVTKDTRYRTKPAKWKVSFETTTEKRGLTWDQAQRVKTNLNRKIGKRKGTRIKVVPY